MLRRRILIEADNDVLTLSSYSGNAGYSSNSTYVYVYLNGVALKEDGVTITSSETWCRGTWYKNYGYVVIYYDGNDDLDSRTATLTISYKKASVRYTLTQNGGVLYSDFYGVVLDGTAGSSETIQLMYPDGTTPYSANDLTVSILSGKVNASVSNGRVTITAKNTVSTGWIWSGDVRVYRNGEKQFEFDVIQRPQNPYTMIDGYPAIDMGTPDGLKWCAYNVGASSETDNVNNYSWGAGATPFTCNVPTYYTGTDATLPSQYDTAVQVMGGGWYTPTYNEAYTLSNGYWNSGHQIERMPKLSYNGTKVFALYSNVTKNALLFPYNGYILQHSSGNCSTYDYPTIWTSSFYRIDSYGNEAYGVEIRNTGLNVTSYDVDNGLGVRAVHA